MRDRPLAVDVAKRVLSGMNLDAQTDEEAGNRSHRVELRSSRHRGGVEGRPVGSFCWSEGEPWLMRRAALTQKEQIPRRQLSSSRAAQKKTPDTILHMAAYANQK
jgi:hypothetical protein